MKSFIKYKLRERLLETIDLNLTKQIRREQINVGVDEQLDNIFGKNVYRLYYDLSTGKQFTPTRKNPKLKFDVNIQDRLQQTISKLLGNYEFEVVDFEKNIAKNVRNNQNTKISKILNGLDIDLKNSYTSYLDSLTRKEDGGDTKLYVVISRHSHDIASMSSKPKLGSCEDLSDFTDIKQTLIPSAIAGYDEDREGGGQYIWDEIVDSSIITYLIEDGDWNIQDPLGRILGTNLCQHYGNRAMVYGKYEKSFKNFWVEWVGYYRDKVLKKYDIEFDEDFFKKDVGEILKEFIRYGEDNERQIKFIIRGLIINKRFDVFNEWFKDNNKSDGYMIRKINYFQPKVLKKFPSETQNYIKLFIDKELDKSINSIKIGYKVLTDNEAYKNIILSIKQLESLKTDVDIEFIISTFKLARANPFDYENVAKAYNVEKLNMFNRMRLKVEDVNWVNVAKKLIKDSKN